MQLYKEESISNQSVAGGCLIHPSRPCIIKLVTLSTLRPTRLQSVCSRTRSEYDHIQIPPASISKGRLVCAFYAWYPKCLSDLLYIQKASSNNSVSMPTPLIPPTPYHT